MQDWHDGVVHENQGVRIYERWEAVGVGVRCLLFLSQTWAWLVKTLICWQFAIQKRFFSPRSLGLIWIPSQAFHCRNVFGHSDFTHFKLPTFSGNCNLSLWCMSDHSTGWVLRSISYSEHWLLADHYVSNRQQEWKVTRSMERVMTQRILQYLVTLRSAAQQLSLQRVEGESSVTTQPTHIISGQVILTLLYSEMCGNPEDYFNRLFRQKF